MINPIIPIAVIFFIAFLVITGLEAFGFNMTEELKRESTALLFCMNTDIYLPECETIYGGKDYGDKIK